MNWITKAVLIGSYIGAICSIIVLAALLATAQNEANFYKGMYEYKCKKFEALNKAYYNTINDSIKYRQERAGDIRWEMWK